MRLPMWVEKGGRAVWNGRDTRGHFDTLDRVSEARFRGEDAPKCPHPCCNGKRPHPAGLPVMKAKTKAKPAPKRKAPTKRKAPATTAGRKSSGKPAGPRPPSRPRPPKDLRGWEGESMSGLGQRGRQTAAARKTAKARQGAGAYADYLHAQYLDAERVTRGNMVTKAGRARGYVGADFFKAGRRPSVERWGTDELRAWFGSGSAAGSHRRSAHRVLTRAEFDAQQRRAA